MSEEDLNKKLVKNWNYLNKNQKELLLSLGVSPEKYTNK